MAGAPAGVYTAAINRCGATGAESPLLAFRICMEKDNYATTCTTRLTFSGNLPANSELCMWVFHQRVVELTYGDEPAPIKVLSDEVVG